MNELPCEGRDVIVGERRLPMQYAVRQAFELDGRIIVLFDPDDYLKDPAYPRERRRGQDALRNLRAYSRDGELLWQAEFPEPADYYYRIVRRSPLTVLSFSSYRCRIDPTDGRIAEKEFYK